MNAYFQTAGATSPPWPGNANGAITSGNTSNSGGTSCSASLVDPSLFINGAQYAKDPRTEWFAGQYAVYSAFGGTNNEASGLAEFPIDPRSFTDPNVPVWP